MKRTVSVLALVVATSSTLVSAAPAEAPTWTKNVGPLMAEKCMNCHRPSEVAPMSFLTYREVRPWAMSIREEVERRVMPPWYADPRYGRFANDRRLKDEEIRIILDWVDAGAPHGEGTFEPPDRAAGWLLAGELGEPDFVFEMEEEFVIPATGPDINVNIMVPVDLEEEIWVQAVEIRGNNRVVHHNLVHVMRPDGTYDPSGRLGMAVPGKQWDRFPEGAAKLLRPGSTLRFDLHYHPDGTQEYDRSRLGVWLARNPIEYIVHSSLATDLNIEIPPYEPNYESVGEFVFPVDGEVVLLNPHMHWRGKDMRLDLIRPGGREETLLLVPKYDMNWQISYALAEPVPAPKGSILRATAHFDNSENNPWNPDPSVKVLWGLDSRDEMMEGWFDYRVKTEEVIVPPSARVTEASPGSKK